VSIGSVYQYFPNKDAILVALVHRHLAEGTAALQLPVRRLLDGAPFEDALPGIVGAVVAIHAAAPSLHRVLFEEAKLPASLRAELDELEDRLVALVARSLGDTLSSPLLSARMVISAIEGLTHRLVLRPPPGVTPEEIGEEITKLVRAYLRAAGCAVA
jgi:AcrR family transcriptional regulator